MTKEELEEIKTRVEGDVYYLHAKRDVHRLLEEIERLQEENARVTGILGTIMTDIDKAEADGRL